MEPDPVPPFSMVHLLVLVDQDIHFDTVDWRGLGNVVWDEYTAFEVLFCHVSRMVWLCPVETES